MGQYWRLVDLDGGLQHYLGKLGEQVWVLSLHRLLVPGSVTYLKPLDEIHRDVFTSARHRLPPMQGQKQSPLLAKLPADVLGLIFDCFGDTEDGGDASIDAVCFALTCQMCFDVGYAVLQNHQNSTSQTWAGHRIILVGDYQEPKDVPACLAHVLPREWMEPETNIYNETADWPQRWKDLKEVVECHAFPRLSRAARLWKEIEAVRCLEYIWRDVFGIRTPPRMSNPVLRDLNTKEYARSDALKKAQARHGPEGCPHYGHRGFKDLRIGDLAVFRLCWTSDPSAVDIEAHEGIARGPWAGHFLDIVDISQIKQEEGWKDVSRELISEVAKIYRANWPADHNYVTGGYL